MVKRTGALHRGGDCLADLHVPSNHHAINRGSNHGAIEVHARLRDDRPRCRDVRVGGPDVGRRLQHCGLCEIEFGARELLIAGKAPAPPRASYGHRRVPPDDERARLLPWQVPLRLRRAASETTPDRAGPAPDRS
jgi:hypothetical protein